MYLGNDEDFDDVNGDDLPLRRYVVHAPPAANPQAGAQVEEEEEAKAFPEEEEDGEEVENFAPLEEHQENANPVINLVEQALAFEVELRERRQRRRDAVRAWEGGNDFDRYIREAREVRDRHLNDALGEDSQDQVRDEAPEERIDRLRQHRPGLAHVLDRIIRQQGTLHDRENEVEMMMYEE